MTEKEIIMYKGFDNIKLSLRALDICLINQIENSERNYLYASDIDISLEFIKSLKKTRKLMYDLFGNTLKVSKNLCELTSIKK